MLSVRQSIVNRLQKVGKFLFLAGGTLCGAVILLSIVPGIGLAFVRGWVMFCSFWAAALGVALIEVSTPNGSKTFESKNCSG